MFVFCFFLLLFTVVGNIVIMVDAIVPARAIQVIIVAVTQDDPKQLSVFRMGELDALTQLSLQCVSNLSNEQKQQWSKFQHRPPTDVYSPFIITYLPSTECAQFIMHRSITLKAIYECWAFGNSIATCLQNLQTFPLTSMAPFLSEDSTFSVKLQSCGVSFKTDQSDYIRELFHIIPFKGKVNASNPQYEFRIFIDCGMPRTTLTKEDSVPDVRVDQSMVRSCMFGRLICNGRSYAHNYALNERRYIGPTSLPPTLSFIMGNFVGACPGRIIFDPFVGTGSILIGCAVLGAHCIGSDFDWKVLHGALRGAKGNIFDNFSQYNLPRPELICSDQSQLLWNAQRKAVPTFDGIVCDPPYGVRAGARKSGRVGPIRTVVPDEYGIHIPSSQPYDVEDVIADLLDMSAQCLKFNSLLVYLLPSHADMSDDDLPRHPCLETVHVSQQLLRARFVRRLIVMRKVKDWSTELKFVRRDKSVDPNPPLYASVKDLINLDQPISTTVQETDSISKAEVRRRQRAAVRLSLKQQGIRKEKRSDRRARLALVGSGQLPPEVVQNKLPQQKNDE